MCLQYVMSIFLSVSDSFAIFFVGRFQAQLLAQVAALKAHADLFEMLLVALRRAAEDGVDKMRAYCPDFIPGGKHAQPTGKVRSSAPLRAVCTHCHFALRVRRALLCRIPFCFSFSY